MTTPLLDDAGCQLPLGLRAVAVAREFTSRTVAGWGGGGETVATAVLVTSELVTNAVMYGHGAASLRLKARDAALLIEVADRAVSLPQTRPGGEVEIGHGLHVVDAVSRSWGTRPDGGGKIVWCEIELTDG